MQGKHLLARAILLTLGIARKLCVHIYTTATPFSPSNIEMPPLAQRCLLRSRFKGEAL